MRANEFLPESTELRHSVKSAIKGMQLHDFQDNDAYTLYRFGIALAGAPSRTTDATGPSQGMKMITLSYTDGEQEIIDAALKQFSPKTSSLSKELPTEPDFINTVSPMTPKGPIKRKS